MKKYSIYHQKAGAHFWDNKATFESKEEAQKRLNFWGLMDGVKLNENEESYSFDQNYYRVVASDDFSLSNTECQKIWLIS